MNQVLALFRSLLTFRREILERLLKFFPLLTFKKIKMKNEAPVAVRPSSPVGTSKTFQQFKKESDINFLVDRQKRTGSFYDPLAYVSKDKRQPMFGDFSDVPSIGSAWQIVSQVSEKFMKLPSELRAYFNNSPEALYAFAVNPDNYAKCVELGIFPKQSQSTENSSSESSTVSTESTEKKEEKA